MSDHALSGSFHLFGVLEREERTGMAEGKLTGLDSRLDRRRKLEQAKEVGNGGTVLASALRHLFLGHVELARKALEGPGLLHWVQVRPLEILNDGDLHRLLVRDLAEDCRDGGFAGDLRRAPTALAGNEL